MGVRSGDASRAPVEARVQLGRRERKKQATRQAIIEAGFRLFAEKGYVATTVAEIAAAADVSDGTFYVHFRGGKPELLFHPIADRLRMLVERLEHRADDKTTLEAFEDQLRQASDPSYPIATELALARRLIMTEVTLTGEQNERWRVRVHGAFRDSFAREFPMPDSGFQTRIMAALALAVSREFGELIGVEDSTPEQLDAYLQQSFAGLRAAQEVLLGSR